MTTSPASTSVIDLVHAYYKIHPSADAREVIRLGYEFEALLNGGWTPEEIAGAIGRYAAIGGNNPSAFARWASRTRPQRIWWSSD